MGGHTVEERLALLEEYVENTADAAIQLEELGFYELEEGLKKVQHGLRKQKERGDRLDSLTHQLKIDLEDVTSTEQLMNLRFQVDSIDKRMTQIEDAQKGDTISASQVDLILKVKELEERLDEESKTKQELFTRLSKSEAKVLELQEKLECPATTIPDSTVDRLLARIESLSNEVVTLRNCNNTNNHLSNSSSKVFSDPASPPCIAQNSTPNLQIVSPVPFNKNMRRGTFPSIAMAPTPQMANANTNFGHGPPPPPNMLQAGVGFPHKQAVPLLQAQQVAYNAAQREAQLVAVRGVRAAPNQNVQGDAAQNALPSVLNAFIPFA